MDEKDFIYDWNTRDPGFDWTRARGVELDDETLRDGLQNPSVVDPSMDKKITLLHMMEDLGIQGADLGLPGAGPRAYEDVERLAQEIVTSGLSIVPNAAARTTVQDIRPIAEISQTVGMAIEVAAFIGSSPIRQYAEDWTLERMLSTSEKAIRFSVSEGLPVMFVTEDTVRARPETLAALYGRAIEWGVRRICLADTVGHATPDGVRSLVRFVRTEILDPSGEDVKLDWHGHRDRGLGLANALAAVEGGVDRVHATALGVGERVGNVEMDLLILNLKLLGAHDGDLTRLPEYCALVSEACDIPIPHSYPVVGADAFRTATGVHAAAIVKAAAKGDAWLADRIYSGVPASWVGRIQEIEIGPMSGLSNVKHWLTVHGHDPDDEALCQRVLDLAKVSDRTLTADDISPVIKPRGGATPDQGSLP